MDWIKLHRSIQENEFYFAERFTKAQAWIDLLLLGTFKERTVFLRGVEVHLMPGELCYSQVSLAKRWQWNERTVNKFLKMLQEREMIQSRITYVTTVISIRNWNLYQNNTEQNAEQSKSRIQTNKKGKKEKNVGSTGTISPLAEKIYSYYSDKVRAGAKSDAVRNISKLLKEHSEGELLSCIDRYSTNGMSKEAQYRIQANNFFGEKQRFKDYLGMGSPETAEPKRTSSTPQITETQKFLMEQER
jgi:DNA-binding transcriptional regulator YhcF (GntR family)